MLKDVTAIRIAVQRRTNCHNDEGNIKTTYHGLRGSASPVLITLTPRC